MFSSNHHQLLQLHGTNHRPMTKSTKASKIAQDDVKPHKIAAIKKHIYDRNGQITDKGKLILKELGVKHEDLEDKPITHFQKLHEKEDLALVRQDFHKNKRISRLIKLQTDVYPFVNNDNKVVFRPEKGTPGHIADGGRFTSSMATIFNKKVGLPERKNFPIQYSTGGIQSPCNDQSISVHNMAGQSTFFTEAKCDNLISPQKRQRPGTAGLSRTLKVKLSRTTTQADPFSSNHDDLNVSQLSTTNKTTTMSRPMSISMRLQEERDLKWMRVQESSLTRNEERDQLFRSKLSQYDKHVKLYEKKVNEEKSDRKEIYSVKQSKRDLILDQKKRTFVEADDHAYQKYMDEVQKRKDNSSLSQTRGVISRSELKVSQSQQNLKTLNKSLSASSIKSTTSQQVQNRAQINKDVELQLDTIKERLRKSHVRRKVAQNEIQDRCKQHSSKLEKSLALHSSYLADQSKATFQKYIQDFQKRNQASYKSTVRLQDNVDYKKQKNYEKRERSQSTRTFLSQDRDKKLQKIVTEYHQRIDQQVQERRQGVKAATVRKQVIDQEWSEVHHDNNQFLVDKRHDLNDQILQKQRIIDRSIKRMNQLREFKQDLSLQSNFARRIHKKMIVDQLQKEKHLLIYKPYTQPIVLQNRPKDFRKQISGTQGFSIKGLFSPKVKQEGAEEQSLNQTRDMKNSYHH